MYILKFTDDAVADIRTISKEQKNTLRKALLSELVPDPKGRSKALRKQLDGFRSFAHGEYRVVFKIFDDLRAIAVVGVGLRSPQSTDNIYRKLEKLAATGELAQGVLFSIRRFTR